MLGQRVTFIGTEPGLTGFACDNLRTGIAQGADGRLHERMTGLTFTRQAKVGDGHLNKENEDRRAYRNTVLSSFHYPGAMT